MRAMRKCWAIKRRRGASSAAFDSVFSTDGYNDSMSSAPQTQTPSPAIIFDNLNAHVRTAALRGAIELDLFSAIAEGNTSVDAIAKRIHASPKGTRVLCDYLTIDGLLTKQSHIYGLTAESAAFLNRHSPAYMGT